MCIPFITLHRIIHHPKTSSNPKPSAQTNQNSGYICKQLIIFSPQVCQLRLLYPIVFRTLRSVRHKLGGSSKSIVHAGVGQVILQVGNGAAHTNARRQLLHQLQSRLQANDTELAECVDLPMEYFE